jgi:hypothetical protein
MIVLCFLTHVIGSFSNDFNLFDCCKLHHRIRGEIIKIFIKYVGFYCYNRLEYMLKSLLVS